MPIYNERVREFENACETTRCPRSLRVASLRRGRRLVCIRGGRRRAACECHRGDRGPLCGLPRGRIARGRREARRRVDGRAARVCGGQQLVSGPPRDRVEGDAAGRGGAAFRRRTGHGCEVDPRGSGEAAAQATALPRPQPVAAALPRGICQHGLRHIRLPPAGIRPAAGGRPGRRLPEGGRGAAALRRERRWLHAAG